MHVTNAFQGPQLQCLIKVKEDLSKVLIFPDAKFNVSKETKTHFFGRSQRYL